jgi:hypothetical protein
MNCELKLMNNTVRISCQTWLALADDFRTIDWAGETRFPDLVLKDLNVFAQKKSREVA